MEEAVKNIKENFVKLFNYLAQAIQSLFLLILGLVTLLLGFLLMVVKGLEELIASGKLPESIEWMRFGKLREEKQ